VTVICWLNGMELPFLSYRAMPKLLSVSGKSGPFYTNPPPSKYPSACIGLSHCDLLSVRVNDLRRCGHETLTNRTDRLNPPLTKVHNSGLWHRLHINGTRRACNYLFSGLRRALSGWKRARAPVTGHHSFCSKVTWSNSSARNS
jgi:hypothetical protein